MGIVIMEDMCVVVSEKLEEAVPEFKPTTNLLMPTTNESLDPDDYYTKYKKLQMQLESLAVQEAYIKVIMATNRADTLDPALLRPGRLDRKIEFPLPDRRQKRLVFATITTKMNLSDEVDLEDFVARPD